MSLGARATKGGAKAGKDKHAPEKTKGADKPQPKEKTKPQATTEQLRMAHMIDRKSEDASDVRRMVQELMEMTCRTEEEVCSALHDADNDLEAACNLLLEDKKIQGEWQTSEKKKKKPAAPGNGEVDDRPRDRDRSGPRPRRGEGEGGRGPGRGGARGRGSGRGARGAARGGRRGPPRGDREPRNDDWSNDNNLDNNAGANNMGDSFPATEDWDNEEWSGSLSDTKVFTPSTNTQSQPGDAEAAPTQAPATEDWDAPATNGPVAETHIPTYTYHNAHHSIIDQINSANNHTAAAVAAVASATQPAAKEPLDYHAHHHQPMGMSGSLSAAQSQYLSQLTAQSQRHEPTQPPVYQYPVYQDGGRKQRARLPPPSKIPSSAVEMPGGLEPSTSFLDVQFGALSPDTLSDHDHLYPPHAHTDNLSSPLPAESAPSQPPAAVEVPAPTPDSVSLEKQLSAAMKQLSVSPSSHTDTKHKPAARPTTTKPVVPPATQQPTQPPQPTPTQQPQQQPAPQQQTQPAPQQQTQQNVYHHAVSHHPPVYQPNVYAAQQVNSTAAAAASLSASAMSSYPSSVTLTQYQPMINSYQQQPGVTVCVAQTTGAAANVAGAYSALYTTGTAYYQPPPHKLPPATQYESSAASSNSLASTSTTQTSTAKVATTSGPASGSGAGATATAGYAALYGAAGAPAYAYDDQLLQRTTTLPHHMTGYYEVGYGVGGVGAGREGTFGLGAGERFGRTDAASPQQVPAALPPGYAYFYQPPPSTYQYGVYPYGGGSSVGGVSVSAPGKVSTYTQQQPYDQQDSYKPGGPYSGTASKSAAGNSADLSNAMYKTHVALNKVNSYEKAAFHSGTPPPFGAGSHLYIPAPPHHHHHHQMDARVNSSHNRRESGAAGGRAGAAKPPPSKPAYSQSYWAPN